MIDSVDLLRFNYWPPTTPTRFQCTQDTIARMWTLQLFAVLIVVTSVIPIVVFSLYVPLDPDYNRRKGDLIGVPKYRDAERNRHHEFEFISQSSKIREAYGAFPPKSNFEWNMKEGIGILYGDGCDVQLELKLIDFMQAPNDTTAAICLFQEDPSVASQLFMDNTEISILGHTFEPKSFFQNLQPVTGFVMGEYNSLVSGYIVNDFFYGTIRVYDPFPGHNVIFYVEPIENLGLYNGYLINATRTPTKNAILYEYLRHEDGTFSSVSTPPPTTPSSIPGGPTPVPSGPTPLPGGPAPPPTAPTPAPGGATPPPTAPTPAPGGPTPPPTTPTPVPGGQNSPPTPPAHPAAMNFEEKALENINLDEGDIFERTIIKSGKSNTRFFDSRRDTALVCEVCVWVQPNLAKKYGFGEGVELGVGEIITMLKFVQHVYQGIDFNRDGLADELQLLVKSFIVSDEIQVFEDPNYKKPGTTSTTPATGLGVPVTSVPGSAQPVTATAVPGVTSPPVTAAPVTSPPVTAVPVTAAPVTAVPVTAVPVTAGPGSPAPVTPDPGLTPPGTLSPGAANTTPSFNEEILDLTPKAAYSSVKAALANLFAMQKCCVILGYMYHNMAPKIAVSSLAGACSKRHTVGLISGYLHDHKITKYDMYRATMHALGHLFGAKRDINSDPRCKVDLEDTIDIFNELLMDNFQKTDIGIRPNSMRYSPCAKSGIATFLTSANANCLKSVPKSESPYCGNGVIEKGEECDCGLLWQCHVSEVRKPACCGESDSFLGCTRLGTAKFQQSVTCHRPWDW